MRILLISNMWPSAADPVFGVFVARQAEALRAAGAEVTVVANSDSRTGVLAALPKYAWLALRAWWLARQREYDVVVGHYLYPTAAISSMAARRAGVPLVLVTHGTDTRSVMRTDRFARAGRKAMNEATLVVAVSNALERVVRDELELPASVPTAVINMGVDVSAFGPDPEARTRLGLTAEERIVLFAGTLSEGKGVDVLLEAFLRAHPRVGGQCGLVLVGAGPAEETLRERLRALDLTSTPESASPEALASRNVLLAGTLRASELSAWMAAADVFVLPSRNEGLGLVLLEAMACGTPCVGTRVGGIPEVLDEPACGRLVPPDDAGALAAAIIEVLSAGKDSYTDACIAQAAKHSVGAKAEELLGRLEEVAVSEQP